MNFHCLGQLFCVGSVPCYLLREQNNLKGDSLPHKYFRPTKILPGNALRILPSVCHKSWILFPGNPDPVGKLVRSIQDSGKEFGKDNLGWTLIYSSGRMGYYQREVPKEKAESLFRNDPFKTAIEP